ncbi:MAG: c-type cytochrome [Limnohabitans sp.]|nr:c-type cytochrome [Limnohabitans sp.]
MFNCLKYFLMIVCVTCLSIDVDAQTTSSTHRFVGIGRETTPAEIKAWDIDVRPDFEGLPKGSGSVKLGQEIWETKCASCHGIFGESNEVFNPLIGGTTQQDIQTGRVANLKNTDYPIRTTIMRVATLSTLWDFINRAMPWDQPKSLSVQEVFAVTGYMLHLADIVSKDFVLSDDNIRDVQKKMPNRNGMTTQHAKWPGMEFNPINRPDTQNVACIKNCAPEPRIASFLPDYARNAHGNLQEQNRGVGLQRGVNTLVAKGFSLPTAVVLTSDASKPTEKSFNQTAMALLAKHGCTVCHAMDKKIVGPSISDITKKHANQVGYLTAQIRAGGSGVWGNIPMPAQSLPLADAKSIAQWIAQGAGR